MAPREKPNEDGEGGPAHGSNVPDGEKLLPFVQRVENLHGEIASLKGEFMASCKTIREDIKDILTEAKDAGFNKKALKGLIKKRGLERDMEDIANDLEGDDSDAYAAMCLALEKLGPLGEAAMKAAA